MIIDIPGEPEEGLMVGSSFEFTSHVTNKMAEDYEVNVSFYLATVFNTGVTEKVLKEETISGKVPANASMYCQYLPKV